MLFIRLHDLEKRNLVKAKYRFFEITQFFFESLFRNNMSDNEYPCTCVHVKEEKDFCSASNEALRGFSGQRIKSWQRARKILSEYTVVESLGRRSRRYRQLPKKKRKRGAAPCFDEGVNSVRNFRCRKRKLRLTLIGVFELSVSEQVNKETRLFSMLLFI